MADDEDAIYVDVIPKLDEAAADEAAKSLQDKFKDAGKGVTDSLGEATKSFGRGFKDYLDSDIKDSIKDYGRNIRDELKGGDLKGAFEDIGHTVKNATDMITNLGEAVGVKGAGSFGKTVVDTLTGLGDGVEKVQSKIHEVTAAIDTFKKGDFAGALSGINSALGGIASGTGLEHIVRDLKTIQDTRDAVRDTVSSIKGLVGVGETGVGAGLLARVGLGATATGALGAAVLPAAILGGTALGIRAAVGADNTSWQAQLDQINAAGGVPATPKDLSRAAAVVNPPGPGKSLTPMSMDQAAALEGMADKGDPDALALLNQRAAANDPEARNYLKNKGGAPAVATANLPDPKTGARATNPVAAPLVGGDSASAAGQSVVRAGSALVQTTSAVISAGSISLGGLGGISIPGASSTAAGAGRASEKPGWADLVHRASGGVIPGSSPGYDNMIGLLPGGQAIGLEGGEGVLNPGAMQQPGMAALIASLNKGYAGGTGDAAGDTVGGAPAPSGPSGVRGTQAGGSGNSIFQGLSSAGPKGQTGGAQAGIQAGENAPYGPQSSSGTPQTTIPQGTGPGFGIQGGILGGAEGAAASAADAFLPGSGAAVQIATQEANRAIKYGVQAGTILGVEAPLDTFWLSDSGLSDPSHSWFGKLGLSMIGQLGQQAQNVAGKTQAPLTPGQGQGSPLGGQQQGQGGPAVHIENQYNTSDVDHTNNNQTLAGMLGANSATSNSSYQY